MHFVSDSQMEKRSTLISKIEKMRARAKRVVVLKQHDPELIENANAYDGALGQVIDILNRNKFSMSDMRDAEALFDQIKTIYQSTRRDIKLALAGEEPILKITSVDGDKRIRSTIHRDDEGNYHIDRTIILDNAITTQADIHGPMSTDAYIAWLTNALFNASYMASSKEDRKWMLND